MSIGFSADITQNKLNAKFIDQSQFIKEKQGMGLDLLLLYKINSLILVAASPGVIQKSYSIEYVSGAYQYFKNSYVQIPVLLQFDKKLNARLKMFFDGGFCGGYWVFGRTKGLIPNVFNVIDSTTSQGSTEYIMLQYYDGRYSFDKTKDRRFEFSWIIGAGIAYEISRLSSLFFKSQIQQAFTSQQKKYMLNQIPRYNQTVAFYIGFMRKL